MIDYDAAGTEQQRIVYTYDLFDRLIKRSYDDDGSQGPNSPVDTYWAGYVGYEATLEFDGNSQADLSHRYLFGPGNDMILADEQIDALSSPGNVLWGLSDHLGTVRDVADFDSTTGTTSVVNHRVFDSFGKLESETNSAVDFLFGYTGKPTDEVTGMTNHWQRWYDPALGKWISTDPIGFAAGDANLYRYVGNDVNRLVDSNGMQETGATGGGLIGLTPEGFTVNSFIEDPAQQYYEMSSRGETFWSSSLVKKYDQWRISVGLLRQIEIPGAPSDASIYSTAAHGVLDLAGMIPVVGVGPLIGARH